MSDLFKYETAPLSNFLQDAEETKDHLIKTIIRGVDQRLAELLTAEGLAFGADFRHVLDNYAVRHIMMKHSNEKEALRGQIQIHLNDFLLLPDILMKYDSVSTLHRNGKMILLYEKRYPNFVCHLIEEVRPGRKEISTVTFYKTKKGKLTGADS